MRSRFAEVVTALALAGSAVAGTGAQAHCWQTEEVSAATIRDLQSLLMVAALRCEVAGHGMTADYNSFLRANKLTIQQMNYRLKAHFIKASAPTTPSPPRSPTPTAPAPAAATCAAAWPRWRARRR